MFNKILKKKYIYIFLFIFCYQSTYGSELFKAAEHNDFSEVKKQIESGYNVDFPMIDENNHRHTALMMACKNLNYKIVKLLIDNGANVRIVDSFGDCALGYTMSNLGKYPSIFGEREEKEDKEQEFDFINDETKENFKKIISLLLLKGIDINYSNEYGVTLLHRAAEKNVHPDIIKILLRFGANPILQDQKGKRPIDLTENPTIRKILSRPIRKHECIIL